MNTRSLARIGRLATLPETRGLIVAAAQSETLREMARQAVHDRAGLVRGLRGPANPRDLLLKAARHPAVRELANAGLLFLPGRYLPLGWAASWATRRVLRRHVDPPPKELDAAGLGPPNRRGHRHAAVMALTAHRHRDRVDRYAAPVNAGDLPVNEGSSSLVREWSMPVCGSHPTH